MMVSNREVAGYVWIIAEAIRIFGASVSEAYEFARLDAQAHFGLSIRIEPIYEVGSQTLYSYFVVYNEELE